jgi:hypothetical protein
VVSDLHTGSHLGLWHPSLKNPYGETANMNAGQRWLYECWRDLYKLAKQRRPSVLVVNGDLLDGEGRKSMGTEQYSTITAAQQKAAIKLLEPFADIVDEVVVLVGTPYHDGVNGSDVEAVATALGAVPRPGNKDWHSHENLDLDVDGVTINFNHEIAIASSFYRATPYWREMMFAAMAELAGAYPHAKCIVRSHAHSWVHVENVSQHVIGTPCFQLQTFYMTRKSPYRMVPDIGGVFIEVDHQAHRQGHDPIRVRKWLFPLPARKPIKSGVKSDE